MSPDQINAKHGKPSWRCVTCRAESGLHWWRGMSVAVCSKPVCSKAFGDKCRRQEEEQDAFDNHVREHYGD